MATPDDDKPITPRKIVFVHPDLGIGGAERLVIDAVVGLQSLGHKVTILTSHRDKNHCFEPARDGTLDVRVRGDAVFPTTIAGGLSIVLAMLRQLALVFSVALSTNELKTLDPDVIFVDQLSICIPFLRWLHPKAKVLFYGHFPDRLLANQGEGLTKYAKAVYRAPFDGIEGWSTACADDIVVNSKFTRAVFKGTFDGLRKRELKVIYPCVDTSETQSKNSAPLWPDKKVILSINRFEGKKNLSLAIHAYAGLSLQERSKAKLILAGGFDPATPRTQPRTTDSKTSPTPSNSLTPPSAATTLSPRTSPPTTSLMVYTPPNEHFGIVPLEAMLAGVPVLATDSGGPLETIYDGRTGFLRRPESVELWTDVMRKTLIPSSESALHKMGQKGKERVLAEFSQTKMVDALDREIQALCRSTGPRPTMIPDWLYVAFILSGMSVVVCVLMLGLLVWAVNHDKENRLNSNGSLTGTVVEVVTSTTSMAGWEELWESAKASKRARGRDEL
ncbi:Alpha-1,3-mannosyltransferase-like protein [Friedmanniomyces endolithicus]|nr:Alpha-1,3-mannosyltransferase-like protein [Friedmanniomyces endolithicus]